MILSFVRKSSHSKYKKNSVKYPLMCSNFGNTMPSNGNEHAGKYRFNI